MEIRTKFNVNDEIWTINKIHGYERCPKCRGNSKVLVGNIDYYCKECYGEGKKLSQEVKWRVSENSYTITQIKTFTDEGGTDVTYFGGKIWDRSYLGEEKNCFATEEEAQKECDKRNGTI